MPSLKTAFFCQNCGTHYPKWLGQCGSCKEWNTLIEEVIENPKKKIFGFVQKSNVFKTYKSY